MKWSNIPVAHFSIQNSYSYTQRNGRRLLPAIALLLVVGIAFPATCRAQNPLAFQVSNPRHLEWSAEEAGRIYLSACTLVARAIRPENPPPLRPKFMLVLGAENNETVRTNALAEIHLKHWDPQDFAQAVVIMATREVLQSEEMSHLTHDALLAAGASVSVHELKRGH